MKIDKARTVFFYRYDKNIATKLFKVPLYVSVCALRVMWFFWSSGYMFVVCCGFAVLLPTIN